MSTTTTYKAGSAEWRFIAETRLKALAMAEADFEVMAEHPAETESDREFVEDIADKYTLQWLNEHWSDRRPFPPPEHDPRPEDTAGAAPVPARTPRRREHRAATRSSARSGDSGSEDDEPEPPTRRLCAFCGKEIPADRSTLATYCSDRHADRDRQRRKRQRDRARSQLPPTPRTADYWRMEEFRDGERELLRMLSVCRCNGDHLEFEPGSCFRCGRWLPDEISGGLGLCTAFMARLDERERVSA